MSLAGRLSRLSPHIHLAPEHPPTLAGINLPNDSEIALDWLTVEEFAGEQIDTIIRLYETKQGNA